MKKWIKYIISTLIFFVLYILIVFLIYPTINWKQTIFATILYGISYAICNELFSKILK